MSLEELMANQLPLNRKERYYTGTVFPMIVCRNSFRDFPLFTSLIKDFPQQTICATPDQANIQFFTEYSLAESIFGIGKDRFLDPPLTRDTPDILVLIQGSAKVLIAVEAKMYDLPTAAELIDQMNKQHLILEYIRESLTINYVYHLALLPEHLSIRLGTLPFQVITWQSLYESFVPGYEDDYFLEVLRLALHRYHDLVSKGIAYGQNSEGKIRGIEIYDGFKRGELSVQFMGRDRGLRGAKLAEDLQSGRWRDFMYETNTQMVGNRNWFRVEDFVALIDGQQEKPIL